LHGLASISIELSVRFRALLESYEKMSRIDSAESRPILNHHREDTLAARVYDGHAVEVNNATAHCPLLLRLYQFESTSATE
jgi:hypothetical protein